MPKPYNIENIVALQSEIDFVSALYRELAKMVARKEWLQANAEGHFAIAYDAYCAIGGDGLHGFFMNAAALPLRDAYAAFVAVGAHRRAELLKFAMGIFPDGEPPEDESYMTIVENLTPEQKEAFDNLESHFYALKDEGTPEDFYKLLRAYVEQNIQDFK